MCKMCLKNDSMHLVASFPSGEYSVALFSTEINQLTRSIAPSENICFMLLF